MWPYQIHSNFIDLVLLSWVQDYVTGNFYLHFFEGGQGIQSY